MISRKQYCALSITLACLVMISPTFEEPGLLAQIDENTRAVDDYIKQLSVIQQPEESRYEVSEKKSTDGDYVCQTSTYVGAPGYSEMIFKRTNVDVLYPGALLNGESVHDGSYALSALPRAPVTLTVDLYNLPGPVSRTVENPTFSSIHAAIHDILSQEADGDVGAEFNWEVMTVYSESQLKAALGMNVDIVEVCGIGADLNFGSKATFQRVVAKYCQKYYDIVIDQPVRPSQFLDLSRLEMTDLEYSFGDVSPMYISSVCYGRMAMFYFESKDLSVDLEAAVRASVNLAEFGVPGMPSVERKLEIESVLAVSNCKAYILGGSAQDAAGAAFHGLPGLKKYIVDGGNYSKQSPGKPMSFTLKYLSNNKPVRVIQTTEYEVTTCVPSAPIYRFTLNEIETSQVNWVSPYGIYIVGPVTVRGGGNGNPIGEEKLFYHPSTPGRYVDPRKPIRIDQSVDIEFGPMTAAERKDAWIEIDVNGLWYNWGFANYAFSPSVHRIYLNEIDNRPICVESTQNKLHLDYTIKPR